MMKRFCITFISYSCLVLFISACSLGGWSGRSPAPIKQSKKPSVTAKKGGGYYKDDGPDDIPPENLDAIPNAVPRVEPLSTGPLRPYTVLGVNYTPYTEIKPYKQRGIASWYGKKFHGAKTSNGETYDMYAMTAAHTLLPLPSYVRVTHVDTGKTVIVRVNDRGPFHADRIIDLSYTAAHKLGIIGAGSGEVIVEQILPNDYTNVAASNTSTNYERPKTNDLIDQHYIQVGAFGEIRNAELLLSQLQRSQIAKGKNLSITQEKNINRVHIGPFNDRSSAELIATELINQQLISSFLIVQKTR